MPRNRFTSVLSVKAAERFRRGMENKAARPTPFVASPSASRSKLVVAPSTAPAEAAPPETAEASSITPAEAAPARTAAPAGVG